MVSYTLAEFNFDIQILIKKIREKGISYKGIYGIPRGGIPAAIAISKELDLPLVYAPSDGILVVDDICDSGVTRLVYQKSDFACLCLRPLCENNPTYHARIVKDWIEFWWEAEDRHPSIEKQIVRIIEYIGDCPSREGLKGTPRRVAASYEELFSGYGKEKEIEEIFTTFKAGTYNQLVLLKGIEFFSICEHHMLPFIGKAHIAYIPDNRILGVSKIVRLLNIYSHRLQIQERICEQITQALMANLGCVGAACVIVAEHLCMSLRGVRAANCKMVASSLKGVFLEEGHSSRLEFLSLIGKIE